MTDEDRAAPGEAVLVRASSLPFALQGWSLWNPLGIAPGVDVSVNGQKAPSLAIGGQLIVCVLPADAGGSFVELVLVAGQQRSNVATIPVRVSDRMRSRLGELRAARAGSLPVIVISGRHIRRHGWDAVSDTLLHEMVHQWQAQQGHPLDHGREFRRKAREVGIVPRAVADLRS